jgi:hypothetical protein
MSVSTAIVIGRRIETILWHGNEKQSSEKACSHVSIYPGTGATTYSFGGGVMERKPVVHVSNIGWTYYCKT